VAGNRRAQQTGVFGERREVFRDRGITRASCFSAVRARTTGGWRFHDKHGCAFLRVARQPLLRVTIVASARLIVGIELALYSFALFWDVDSVAIIWR